MRDVILVLGMHRSGTSAAAGVFVMLGGAPPSTLLEPDAGNERGYFESRALMNFHDELLASAGSSWSDWRRFNPAWRRSSVAAAFRARARQLFEDEFDSEPLAVLKDPRVCRFAPFWLEVLAEANAQARAIIPFRPPLEVAFSLKKRNGFSLATGALLWLRHVLDAELASRAMPRSIFSWDQLLRDWRSVAEKAAADLDLPWPRLSDATAHEIDAFLGEDLVHHRVGAQELAGHPDIHEWTMAAYAAMLELAGEPRSNAALKTLDEIRDVFNRASLMFGRTLFDDEIQRRDLQCETARLAEERERWSSERAAATAERAEAMQVKEQLSLALEARTQEAGELARALAEVDLRRGEAELALASERSQKERIANELAAAVQAKEQLSLALEARTQEAGEIAGALAEVDLRRGEAELALASERSQKERIANELAAARAELEKFEAQQTAVSHRLSRMLAGAEGYRNQSQEVNGKG